jgi:phage recombination protein Bet
MKTKTDGLQVNPQEQSAISQFSNTDIDIIKNSVAKGTTDAELKYFLAVAASTGLNPFQKEIWCYKSGNDMLIFTGRDGFLSNAQRKPDFKGIRSAYVCATDKFKMNVVSGHIEHEFTQADRGAIVGAYAIVKREGMDAFIAWADFKEFNKGYNTWKSNPGSMIKKVAEAHALKQAYSLSGINSEHDYDFQRNTFSKPETEETEYTEIETPAEIVVDEAILTAIEDAKINSEVNNISNTSFFAGDMKNVLNDFIIELVQIPNLQNRLRL